VGLSVGLDTVEKGKILDAPGNCTPTLFSSTQITPYTGTLCGTTLHLTPSRLTRYTVWYYLNLSTQQLLVHNIPLYDNIWSTAPEFYVQLY